MRYDVEMVLEYGGEAVCFSGMLPGNYAEIDLERKHPAVILLAGGAYWRRTPREKEAVALKFLAQGISPWVLEYSVAPHVCPQSLGEVHTVENITLIPGTSPCADFQLADILPPVRAVSGIGTSYRSCWAVRETG